MSIMRCDKHGPWDSDFVEQCQLCVFDEVDEIAILQAEISRLTENARLQDSATAAVLERAEKAEAELAEQCRLHAMGSEREARLMARVAELERDAARWRKVEAMMVHQRCGPNFGWTIDTLLDGDSPTDAIDAAMRGTE